MKTTKIAVAIIIFILIEFAAYIYLESLHKVGINHFLSEKTKELQTKPISLTVCCTTQDKDRQGCLSLVFNWVLM